MNCRMPELKRALERGGFTEVRTVISSGNAVFTSRAASDASLEKRCEAAMARHLGNAFLTIVRPIDALAELLEREAFRRIEVPAGAKRVLTFLRGKPRAGLTFPVSIAGASILAVHGREVYSVYDPADYNNKFMVLIEKTFGTAVTTRTWETVVRIVKAARQS